MLYFIYGEDSYRARKKVREIITNLTERDSTAAVRRIYSENASEEKINDLIRGRDIFGLKSVVVFDGLFVPTKKGTVLMKKDVEGEFSPFQAGLLKQAADSENVYIILEEKPDVKLIRKISKYAEKILKLDKFSSSKTKEWLTNEAADRGLVLSEHEVEFLSGNFEADLWSISQILELKSLGGSVDVRKFLYNPFGLADLFASKKRHEAFRHFHDNLNGGVAPEEMFWRIWWQTKTLLSVLSYKEAGLDNLQIKDKTGLHPFVVRKSLVALSNFSREELEKILENLFLLWRDSKSGHRELGLGVERLILGLA